MYARSTTVRGNPQSLDDAIAYLRDEVMPAVQEMTGCIGMSMMCDRDSGRCIATTAWETEEAMHNSESALHDKRQRFADMMGSIAAAADEQRTGIEQVDAAISLMDSITQQNAALVEEASAAAQALGQQSRELDRQVAMFRI